jgi:hypothetical protein
MVKRSRDSIEHLGRTHEIAVHQELFSKGKTICLDESIFVSLLSPAWV